MEQIRENPYLQYFVGLPGYQMEAPFAPSLFVEIRKRMDQSVLDVFQGAVIDAVESAKPKRRTKRTSEGEEGEPPAASGNTMDEETAKHVTDQLMEPPMFALKAPRWSAISTLQTG